MCTIGCVQTTLLVNVPVPQPGNYIFIVQYFSRVTGRLQELDVEVVTSGGRDNGLLRLPGCPYRFVLYIFSLYLSLRTGSQDRGIHLSSFGVVVKTGV